MSTSAIVRVAAAVTVLVSALAMAACGGDSGPSESERPVTALFVDISGSTKDLRRPGGEFESGAIQTATLTAESQGTLWATVADENTVSHSLWEINDTEGDFVPPDSLEGNDTLIKGALTKQADELEPTLTELVGRQGGRGSDLLGALQMASRLFADYPDRPHDLVLLTDGGINAPGFKLTQTPAHTEPEMDQAIKVLEESGELPDLTGVRIWLGGLGHGFNRDNALAVITFWQQIASASGGELVSGDTSLRLVEFP